MDFFNDLSLKVHLEDDIFFGENQGIWWLSILRVLELELHHDFVEDRNVFDNNSLVYCPSVILFIACVGRNSLNNLELILFLLVFDKILSGNDTDPLLIF